MRRHPRSLPRAITLAIVLALTAVVAGCGTKASDAGGNFQLSPDQLEPTTTSTLPPHTTTTAEAKGASLEVFKDKPAEGGHRGGRTRLVLRGVLAADPPAGPQLRVRPDHTDRLALQEPHLLRRPARPGGDRRRR